MEFCPPIAPLPFLFLAPPTLRRTHRIMYFGQTYEQFRQGAINHYNLHGVDPYAYFAPHGDDAGRHVIFLDGTEFVENYPGVLNLPAQGPLNTETREFMANRRVRKLQRLWRRKLWNRAASQEIRQNTHLSTDSSSVILRFV